MSDEVTNRLTRIETKVDTILAQQVEDRISDGKTQTDVVWLKGGMTILMSIVLSGAGWLAMQYFNNVGG